MRAWLTCQLNGKLKLSRVPNLSPLTETPMSVSWLADASLLFMLMHWKRSCHLPDEIFLLPHNE